MNIPSFRLSYTIIKYKMFAIVAFLLKGELHQCYISGPAESDKLAQVMSLGAEN